MAHKTKAAPHGRQSHHTKRHQITRPAAGGQNLRELHNRNSVLMNFSKALSSASVEGNGTYGKNSYVKGQISTLYSQRNFIQDFALARIGGLKLNHELSVTQNLGNAPVKVGFPHLWGKPLKGCAPRNGGSRTSKVVARKGVNPRVQNCTLLVNQYLKHTTKSGEARYPDIGYQHRCEENRISLLMNFSKALKSALEQNQQVNLLIIKQSSKVSSGQTPFLASGYSCSLAFLRWRRLISPLAAVTRKPAVLSPSCFKLSISSITSWGIRTVVICDFAFFAPVAITKTPCVRCISVYAKKIKGKGLKCISLWARLNIEGEIHLVNAKPGSARNTNRASNHKPLVGVTVMAGSQHTQTRPEFTWLFLAVPKHLPHGKPVVLRTTAATEEEARAEFCGWNMVFAAKIRSQMRCHITFYDDVNRTGLTLEVEAVEGVFNA